MSSREFEMMQLSLAIDKTQAALDRAAATLHALNHKLIRQSAELRFQQHLLRMDSKKGAKR